MTPAPRSAELEPGASRPGLRIRWWMWPVAALLVLASLLIAVRMHGLAIYRDTQAELRGLGYATTMEELVARGPTVDHDRQERLYRLLWSKAKWHEEIANALPFNELQEQRPEKTALDKRNRALVDGAADMLAAEGILAEGPVELSLFGWCERDPAKLRTINLMDAVATRLPNLMGTRAITNWWALRACLDQDPEPHLRQLDRLIAGLQHPGTLIDAMIGLACEAIRDQAHLWLVTRGRLDDARLRAWALEPARGRVHCAAGLSGERCVFQEPASRMDWPIKELFQSSQFFDNTWMILRFWTLQGHDAAFGVSSLAAAEAELLATPPPTIRPIPFGLHGVITSLVLPNTLECVITVTQDDNKHRIVRCAALVAAMYRRNGSLPDALPAEVPAAAIDVNLPQLIYERLSPSRFRMGIDPAAPLPPAIPATRWTKDYVSLIGQPASTKAAVAGRWSLEIDLDAILIQPPEKPTKTRSGTLKPAELELGAPGKP